MNVMNQKENSKYYVEDTFTSNNSPHSTTATTTTTTTITPTTHKKLITYFTDKDVISGRGNGAKRHRGNQVYRNLVKKYQFEYLKPISDFDKHNIVMKVIQGICQNGGRFLKRVYGHDTIAWEVMDVIEIKKKVSQ